MKRMLTAYRRAVWLSSLLVLVTGCAHPIVHGDSSQEYLGMGIVSGTLGEQQRVALCAGAPSSISVVGQVQALKRMVRTLSWTPRGRKSVFRMTRIPGLTDRPI